MGCVGEFWWGAYQGGEDIKGGLFYGRGCLYKSFFARLLAVAASDVTDSELFYVCALEEVCGNFKFSLSEYFLALNLACPDSRDPIYLI